MMNTLEKTFWRNMKTKHTKSFNSWCPNNFKEEIHNPKKVFLPKAVFKNILDFCGDTHKEIFLIDIYGNNGRFEKIPYVCCEECGCRTTLTSRDINYPTEVDKFDKYNRLPICKACWVEHKNKKIDWCKDCNKKFTKKYHFCDRCYDCYRDKKPSCCMIDSDED